NFGRAPELREPVVHRRSGPLLCAELLNGAARRLDLLSRRGAEGVDPHAHRAGDLALTEHLHGPSQRRDQAGGAQRLGRYLALDARQLSDVDHLVIHAEGVVEPTLREAALEGHLSTLEV